MVEKLRRVWGFITYTNECPKNMGNSPFPLIGNEKYLQNNGFLSETEFFDLNIRIIRSSDFTVLLCCCKIIAESRLLGSISETFSVESPLKIYF